jgi:AcrR family transcriptional regulator
VARLGTRFPGQIRQAVKDVALRQIAEGGPQALSVNAIGRELGVSGPALYRYYAGRDALLAELILDAYGELAATLRAAVAGLRGEPALLALADAYRAWATAQPHRYRLLFRPPVPGFDAHEHRLVAAAQESMAVVLEVLTDGRVSDGTAWTEPAVLVWSRMHGLASLEIDGNFASMGLDPAPLYHREVRTVR